MKETRNAMSDRTIKANIPVNLTSTRKSEKTKALTMMQNSRSLKAVPRPSKKQRSSSRRNLKKRNKKKLQTRMAAHQMIMQTIRMIGNRKKLEDWRQSY